MRRRFEIDQSCLEELLIAHSFTCLKRGACGLLYAVRDKLLRPRPNIGFSARLPSIAEPQLLLQVRIHDVSLRLTSRIYPFCEFWFKTLSLGL